MGISPSAVLNLLKRVPSGKQSNVTACTTDRTLTVDETDGVFTNLGASGAVVFTLPQNATKGVQFTFVAQAAQEIRVTPGAAGAIYINGGKQTDNKYVSFDDEGEHLTLICDGNGDWIPTSSTGTFTVEG